MANTPPPPPSYITADQAKFIGLPPRPLDPSARIVDADGRPSAEFHRFLFMHYEWARKLTAVLTGVP